ncbi:MAG: permease [Vallitaleaceae bacterium]|nr:permease [Vallitaleaceae bacterium]
MFKSKMFYIALLLLIALIILDVLHIEVGTVKSGTSDSLTMSALQSTLFQFASMLKVVPPIFLLIGLLDTWVPRETMIRLMGEKSGALGLFIAFFLGTMAAGPLIAAFPVAQVMLKKGARYSNVLFFLAIWSSAKLPILMYQAATMGLKFTLVSNVTLMIFYIFGSFLIEKLLSHEEKQKIYALAEAA